jgi:hypothetical protein
LESTHQAENSNLSILTRHLDHEGSDLGEPGGIRTRDALIKRYLALNGVAARMARGAKAIQLSSREISLQTPPVTI